MARKSKEELLLEAREKEWEARLDPLKMPAHVAIIMDGNGRWARKNGFRSRVKGHAAGIESVRQVVENAARLGFKALTLYAFSRENWQRPRTEVDTLMRYLRKFLVDERPRLQRNNIRLIASGSLDDLPDASRATLRESMDLTRDNTGMVLNLALSYSGRQEIVDAAIQMAKRVQAGELRPEDISIEEFSKRLYAPELGDPDLLIRTSGEFRISNFLLWELAYTEIHITQTLWPDFRRAHLLEALVDYQGRDRRFGKVSGSS
jgi:undecaprenyl diphosphate synthase